MHRIVLVTALLMACGCGPQPEGRSVALPSPVPSQATSRSATVTPRATVVTSPSSVATSQPSTRVPSQDPTATVVAVRGLPPGPASPDTPAPFRWYAGLQSGQCSALDDTAGSSVPEPERTMYASLAQVCGLLARPGADVDWAQARAAVDDTAGVGDCLVVAARQLLLDAVTAHEAAPDAVLTQGPAADGTACPVAIDSVEMISPRAFAVTGPYLFDPRAARVGSVDLQVGESEVEVRSGVPLVRLAVDGPEEFCLPVGAQGTLEVTGEGYSVAADFVADDLGQGACGQEDGTTAGDEPTPAG